VFRFPCVSLVFLLCVVSFSSAQPVIDQSFTPPSSYGGFDASINACCAFVAQTYTAGLTGTLAGVSISVESQSAFPLHVAIRTVTSGLPTSKVLGDVILSSNSSQLSDLIEFRQLIPQVAGQQYAIVVNYLGAPPPEQSEEQGTWHGATSLKFQGLYAGGADFSSVDGVSWTPESGPVFGDLFFKTYMSPPFLPIAIDIKPGSCANRVDPFNATKIPVAILSSTAFNAPGSIDVSSLTFGRTGSEKSLAFCAKHWEDVNGDDVPDLVCYFDVRQVEFRQGDTVGVLRGKMLDGRSVIGTDSIRVDYEREERPWR
jgi:hypothetical protein